MNRQKLISCSEEELARALMPIDDQMNNEGVPASLRAMKGWHLFLTQQELDLPFHDAASERVVRWFRNRADAIVVLPSTREIELPRAACE